MERHEILEMMGELKLAGMRAAFDEVLANGVKRQHAAQQIVGDLLAAEIAEKQARSIRYQVAAAKLPLAKELADFDFAGGLINEGLVRELAVGTFLEQQRNAVLVGGTGPAPWCPPRYVTGDPGSPGLESLLSGVPSARAGRAFRAGRREWPRAPPCRPDAR